MDMKLNQFILLLNKELRTFLSISFGIFLFILFFQPFPLDAFDFNNNLIFVAGLGAIVFVFMVIVRVGFAWLFQKYNHNEEALLLPYVGSFAMATLSSVAFAFYLRYVGSVNISFYIMIKIILICLAPPVVLGIYDFVNELKLQNESLIAGKKLVQSRVEKYEEDYLKKSIEFVSENNTEYMKLLIADVVFIRSADNYVEIVYKEGEIFRKKLIRNTLKNIELQIKAYSNFIRCHRICIVNTHFVEKLIRNYNTHSLSIKGFHEQIPVSRQYLLKLKESV